MPVRRIPGPVRRHRWRGTVSPENLACQTFRCPKTCPPPRIFVSPVRVFMSPVDKGCYCINSWFHTRKMTLHSGFLDTGNQFSRCPAVRVRVNMRSEAFFPVFARARAWRKFSLPGIGTSPADQLLAPYRCSRVKKIHALLCLSAVNHKRAHRARGRERKTRRTRNFHSRVAHWSGEGARVA
jgi:hypothetical protein